MRIGLTVGATALAAIGLSGCAGIPVAVSAASFYLDAVLYLRTEKTSTDHILSAAMDRDCAVLNIFSEGSFCKDAPAPSLVAEMMREVQTVPLDQPVPARGTAPEPAAPIQVAAGPAVTLADGTPAAGAAPLPERKPRTATAPTPVVRTGVIQVAQSSAIRETAARREARYLVVVGSFAKREQAEAHRAQLARANAEIVAAAVAGRTYHRVVLPPSGRGDALRQVAMVRTAGVRDAWLLPWSGRVDVGTAVAALPLVGFLYRI